MNWWSVGGALSVVAAFALSVALIVWSSTAAFGATPGAMTLETFRSLPDKAKTGLVAGAMATTEFVGMKCPKPYRTVAEYVAALTHRDFSLREPWIKFYFMLIDEHKCKIESDDSGEDT